jgi:hypothetical protein
MIFRMNRPAVLPSSILGWSGRGKGAEGTGVPRKEAKKAENLYFRNFIHPQ